MFQRTTHHRDYVLVAIGLLAALGFALALGLAG
jgi:hypothetical protein